MDFSKKGWLKHYLYLRNNYSLKKEYDRLVDKEKNSEPEHILYELLQPTGFLYGYPAEVPIRYKAFLRALRTEKMNIQDKLRIILTESFLNSGLTSPRYSQINGQVDVADALLEAAIYIGKFYRSVYPGLFANGSSRFFRREKKGLALSEEVIDLRTDDNNETERFWGHFFKSSLLFLDVLYFGQWIQAFRDEKAALKLTEKHKQDRLLLFKTILAAAYANKNLEQEEKELINQYLEAAHFDESTLEEARLLLDKGITINYIDFGSVKSTIFKQHLFELAILTVSSDRVINEEEEIFLRELQKQLKLSDITYSSSLIAVESFIVEYWQQARMKGQEEISQLGEHLLSQISHAIRAQASAFKKELQQQPELLQLIRKTLNEKPTTDDRNVIRKGLYDIVKSLPAFRSIALPKSYLTYVNLMKALPIELVKE